ncbi:hypothetical protein SCHPADRAFT_889399 [Schizopora paradoxa]|uniref:Uncharacterized protein n=1 Tax=Schizopora paradoxa TaxID=27342 RepID=A0A0H2SBI7_9AGAM|nr:hypothetical protein SCHPADRAFT_889399 [Schizopora paradoxa]
MSKKMQASFLHLDVVLLSFVAQTAARAILKRDDSGQNKRKLTTPHVIIALAVLGALFIKRTVVNVAQLIVTLVVFFVALYQLYKIRTMEDDVVVDNLAKLVNIKLVNIKLANIKLANIPKTLQYYVPTRAPPLNETSNETEEQNQRPLPSYETVAVPRPAQPPSYSPVPSPPPALVRE